MKLLKLLVLTLFITCLLGVSVFAQRSFRGRVVEVVDGRTAVVEMNGGGRATVVLQFIEVPEPGQPLHQTVRDHLGKLLLEKVVFVNPQGISGSLTSAQIFLNSVNISQQMIRDGAAWYAIREKGGQTAEESAVFENLETQARNEKRGIWSIKDMTPAWEFRAARDAELKIQKEAEEQRRIQEARARDQ